MADNQRKARAGDMIRSLAVIIIPIGLLYWLLSNDIGDYPVQPVDWHGVLTTARAEAPWPVEAPAGLQEHGDRGWVATKATWTEAGDTTTGGAPAAGNLWQLGMLSPDKIYYEVRQTDAPVAPVVADVARQGHQVGEENIAGRTWQRWESPDARTRVIVTTTAPAGEAKPVSTLVIADAGFTELQQYARTLSTQ